MGNEIQSKINERDKLPKEFLELSDDDTWKPCMICNGNLTQVRKALFTCLECGQEYIADEQDMRDEKPFKIIKIKSSDKNRKAK